MKPYINIHAHQSHHQECTEIINLFPQEAEKIILENPYSLFSVGLHPWYIDENSELLLRQIEKMATYSNVVAIGETGLDKLSEINFSEQIEIFKAQIRIAENIRKPLVIHCVKSYQEVLAIKKELHITVPVVFHAFRGKPELAMQLIKQDCYLSVGEKATHIPETIQIIPLDHLFIETDESDIDIADIYQTIVQIKEIQLDNLVDQIQLNFNRLFQNKSK